MKKLFLTFLILIFSNSSFGYLEIRKEGSKKVYYECVECVCNIIEKEKYKILKQDKYEADKKRKLTAKEIKAEENEEKQVCENTYNPNGSVKHKIKILNSRLVTLKNNLSELRTLKLFTMVGEANDLIEDSQNALSSNNDREIRYFISMLEHFNERVRKKINQAKATEANDKKAKDAGYSSYAEMQAEAKKKAEEKRKAAEEKRKAAEAKRVADNKRAEEWAEAFIENARIQSKTNPGFRDLKPGMPYEDLRRICFQERCYGIENIKFSVETKAYGPITNGGNYRVPLVSKLILDMGPITSDGLFLDIVNDLIESDSNIYRKMKRAFDTKYALDFEFSERDRQLFNEKLKRELLVAYSNGQVVLKINRRKKENSYSEDLWLYIEYRDVKSGKLFLKSNRPVEANLDDF